MKKADLVLALIAVLPAALALTLSGPLPTDLREGLQIGGRVTGILGLTWVLLAAALSIRIPGFDRPFGGLTRLWKRHHVLAGGGFLLLLAHPLLLAFAAAPAGWHAPSAVLFPPAGRISVWSGWAALVLFMLFLAPTFRFFGEPAYPRWKRLHRLSGPAVLLALVHTLLLQRSFGTALAWTLWGGLGALAILAMVWRFILAPRLARSPHRVLNVEPLGEREVEIVLEPEERPMRYRAGQFVYMTPEDPALSAGRGEEHPYTLSSAPDQETVRIAVKALGDASTALQTVTPGSRVWLEGPYGSLFEPEPEAGELWLGGGIGLAPFMSRARQLDRRGEPVDVVLLYCAENRARACFMGELEAIETRLPGFRVIPVYAAERGFLSAEILTGEVGDLRDRACYICGPDAMIRSARKLLSDAGIPARRIRSEEFTLL